MCNITRITNFGAFMFYLYSTSIMVQISADSFDVNMGRERITEILSYLYGTVLKINVPNLTDVDNAQVFDDLASAAESCLPDDKVNEIEAVANNFFPEISEKFMTYVTVFGSYIKDDPNTSSKKIPLSDKIGKIAKTFTEGYGIN